MCRVLNYGDQVTTRPPRLLVTDLDNTLWDWFDAWYASFSALLSALIEQTGIDRAVLEEEIRTVHQRHGTTEFSNLVREVPSLVAAASPRDPFVAFDSAMHAQNSKRKAATRLYPDVMDGLRQLKAGGVRIAAYTESGAFWTEWRIKHTELDGVIDVLYSSVDHDLAAGVNPSELRTGIYEESHYGLRDTEHRQVQRGVTKPSADVLRSILAGEGRAPDETVYLGDSLMKDIAMAQAANVLDAHAAYGLVQHRPEYDLLRRVTHWTDADVARERTLARQDGNIEPSVICRTSFAEILPLFHMQPARVP